MLKIKPPVIQLGKCKFGVTEHFFFELYNDYHESIQIDKVMPGCSACTTVDVMSSELKPGQSTLLNVHFTPGSTGIQTKTINILYRMGIVERPQVVAKFQAIVND